MSEASINRHSLIFALDWLDRAFGAIPQLDHLDFLIGMAVWSDNTRYFADDMEMLHRVCFESLVIPLDERHATSRSALARFLNLPLETARRHVEDLVRKGAMIERSDGLICVGFAADLGERGAAIERANADALARFYLDLRRDGVDLPPATWITLSDRGVAAVEPAWVRAATRFSIEYVLLLASEALAAFDIQLPHLLVLFAILRQNIVGRIEAGEAQLEEIYADGTRRPVPPASARRDSSMAHARVRRKIIDLRHRGLIETAEPDGLIVPARVIQHHVRETGLSERNGIYLRRMFSGLNALAEFKARRDASQGEA